MGFTIRYLSSSRRYHQHSHSDSQPRNGRLGYRCWGFPARAMGCTTAGRVYHPRLVCSHTHVPKWERGRWGQPFLHWVPLRTRGDQGIPCMSAARPRVLDRRRCRDREACQVCPLSRLLVQITNHWDECSIVTRPILVSAPEMGNQMPLRVRHVPLDEAVKAV